MTEPKCIDLEELFWDRYKVRYEESYYAERTKKTLDDPWLKIVLCERNGVHIHPWGSIGSDTELAVNCVAGPIGNKLAKMDGTTVLLDGNDGKTIGFPSSMFEDVAKIVHPRKRKIGRPPTQESLDALKRVHAERRCQRSQNDLERTQGP